MTTIAIYDPALCGPTGVCGPEVDPKLAQSAADLKWLQERGVSVTPFSLAQNPAAFVGNATVRTALSEQGADALPLILVDERLVASGTYPSRTALAAAAGVAPGSMPLLTPAATEASGCCSGDGVEKDAGGCCGGDAKANATGGERCCG